MRYLSILGCIVALFLGSGCQSGSSGFRNPFKGQFARTFPNSSPELQTKSKDLREADRTIFEVGDEADETSTTGTSLVGSTPGSADMQTGAPKSELVLMQENADAEFSAGNLQQAARLYGELIRRHPQDIHAHHRLAIIHDQLQAYSMAEQHYRSALAIEPQNVSILNDLGYSYYLQHRYEDSKAYLEHILQIKPDNQLALRNLALVRAAEGDMQQAYALFQQGGLNPEQSQQQIQLAVTHAGEGNATTRESSLGIASTRPEAPPNNATMGLATVGSSRSQPASEPGHSEIRSDREVAFQPTPDLDSAFKMTPNRTPGHLDRSAQPHSNPAAYVATSENGHSSEQRSIARQDNPADYRVERVSYTTPGQPETPFATEADIISTALNTGYGNLFPVISTTDYYGTQRASATENNLGSTDARNAYYEEFGQQPSSTPHVVHANATRSIADGESPAGRVRQASFEQPRVSSNGSSRIQSPSYESGSHRPMMHATPTNSFPVTEAVGHHSPSAPDYYQFPTQERPPAAVSTSTINPVAGSSSKSSGMLFAPETARDPVSVAPDANSWNGPIIDPSDNRSYDLESDASEYAPEVVPMSEQDRKAHELALEHYRRMQQQ